jgi:phospholipase/carboxylesterase
MQTKFDYEVSMPSKVEPGKNLPVLFALHGIGYNEQHMLSVFEDAKEAFILIGIRGHLDHKNGYAYYHLKGYGNPDRELFDKSMKGLESFIEYACETYPIDREKIYVGGFSQGAILSNSLALVLGDKIKGIVSLNGYIPEFVKEDYPIKPIDHLSIYLSDGEFDSIFSPEVGKKNYAYFTEAGASVHYQTYQTGHEIGEDNKNDLSRWLTEAVR